MSPVRASRQFRITLDTNRYSVPAHLAGQVLTLKTSPDRLCIYQGEQLIARHVRSYDRYGDFENPDHPKPLLEQRKKARDQQLFQRFLALLPTARAPLADLAAEAGYADQAHLAREVRRLSGQSPSGLMAELRA